MKNSLPTPKRCAPTQKKCHPTLKKLRPTLVNLSPALHLSCSTGVGRAFCSVGTMIFAFFCHFDIYNPISLQKNETKTSCLVRFP